MSIDRNPAGLILSAGFSSRMKEFKPLMKIGGKTPLEILIDSFRTAGVQDIFVVTGHNAERVSEFLADKGVHLVHNADFEQGMFTSVQKGVKAAHENGNDCFLMTPVDIPLIPPYIIKAVMNRYYDSSNAFTDKAPFVVPCFEGKKGHPLLIPSVYTDEILTSAGEMGMKSVTSVHEDVMIRVDTNCKSMTMDMDTQEAYRELLDFYEAIKYPNEEQCFRILDRCATPTHIVKHCMAVSDSAVAMAEALNAKGFALSVPLVKAAGLIHDCERLKRDHETAGYEVAMDYGYPEVADIVKVHMTYTPEVPVREITEKDIVCLADKLRQEDRIVTLEERLEPVKTRFKDNPEIQRIIEEKIGAAAAVMYAIEDVIGQPVYELLRERLEKQKKEHPAGYSRRVILIRHGEIEKHKEKIFLGQKDVPLSKTGKEQCVIVGLEMQHFDVDCDVIYCSDLARARESAEIIVDLMGERYRVQPEAAFREMALGSWDGMYISDVKKQFPEAYEERGRDMIRFKIDDEAENYVEVRDRAVPRFNEILKNTKGDIVIVSHSGVLLTLKCEIQGRKLEDIRRMKIRRGTYEFLEITDEYLQRHNISIEE